MFPHNYLDLGGAVIGYAAADAGARVIEYIDDVASLVFSIVFVYPRR